MLWWFLPYLNMNRPRVAQFYFSSWFLSAHVTITLPGLSLFLPPWLCVLISLHLSVSNADSTPHSLHFYQLCILSFLSLCLSPASDCPFQSVPLG